MKASTTIFKKKTIRTWAIVSATILLLFVVIDIVATRFSGVISVALGGDVPHEVDAENATVYYQKETASKSEANELAFQITQTVSEEGTILLRNEGNALPLKTAERRVSVFGKNSVNLVYGGSGSGGGDTTFAKKTIFESLSAKGFSVNPTLKAFYENTSLSGQKRPSSLQTNLDDDSATSSIPTYETPMSKYGADVLNSYDGYKDVAFVVISRSGGESMDLSMNAANGANHYLSLDTNEKDLIEHVKSQGFGKIVVILNTLNIVEAGFLEEYGIDACLWIGGTGTTGIMALGEILVGEVTPSGKTTDTWSADFTKDPTFNNFSSRNVKSGDQYFDTDANTSVDYFYVNYEESVYVGYRYYETRAEQEKTSASGSDSWYQTNVVYPFGYGLSYTSFSREVVSSNIDGVVLDGNKDYSVKVKVSNTGNYKGKDVVEVYACLPYTSGGLEKPFKVLIGYVKTPMLYPEAEANLQKPNSCVLEIKIDPYAFASYDYTGKTGFKGYVLEEGDYSLALSTDAHTAFDTIDFSVSKDITWRNDPKTGNTVENLYTDNENALLDSDYMLNESALMSRADLSKLPSAYEDGDRNVDSAMLAALRDVSHNNPTVASLTEMPQQGLAATTVFASLIQFNNVTKHYEASYNDVNWNDILNALTVKEMADLFSQGGFKTLYLEAINKPLTNESDGPVGWCNFISKVGEDWKNNNAYCSQVVMSATWNTELIKEMGETIGEEALWGTSSVSGDGGMCYSGWYAPGANIHRSPFCGRNFEYFSEDPYLTGTIAAAEISGCKSKGVYCYIKHFALNEQETHRNGGSSWVTEQAMREIYLKPFEIAVKEGGTTAVMSSFNRIGTRWTGGDYRLLTQILRNEWGFQGTVICDYNQTGKYMDCKQMIYAGGDLNLATDKNKYWTSYDENSVADVTMLRRAAKNVCYTVANSNAINNLNYRCTMAYWKIGLIVANCVVLAALVAVGLVKIKRVKKEIKQEQQP